MKERNRLILRRALCAVTAALLLLAFLIAAGYVLRPKYRSQSPEGSLTAEYYGDAAEVGHDLLFIGDCEVYESFIPAVLWQEYGISSYVRGSAQQLVWQSYYMLEDTLRCETPQVVVFNVLSLKYGQPQKETYNRMTLDGMEWSSVKADAIRASMTEEESFLTYLLPALRYHSRWDELTREDWKYAFSAGEPVSDSGYLMQTDVKPVTPESLESARAWLEPQVSALPETAMEWLDKLRLLCADRGIELVLIKAPTNHPRYFWYDEWDREIRAYAAEHELLYCNMISEEEIGLDWTTDTYDEGLHLNLTGAEKLTRWFGQYLRTTDALSGLLPDRRSETACAQVWQRRVEIFENRKMTALGGGGE